MEEIIELFRELEKVLDECGNNYSDAELQLINQESAFNKLKLIAYKYWFSDKKELTKYKRAFEILKPYIDFPSLEDFVYQEDGNYYSARIEGYDDDLDTSTTYHYLLDKEEYELLEELMDNENTK